MKKLFFGIIAIALTLSIYACENSRVHGNVKNNLNIYFENVVGNDGIVLNSKTYTNASGEDFTISKLRYFISNIILTKIDGSTLSFKDQYFLVDQSVDSSKIITIKDIPNGDYTSLSFVVGVDSLKSVSDVSQRTGVLDVATNDMYWSWNSGYIFFKMEGGSSKIQDASKLYKFHIGGYGGLTGGTANNLRTISIPFASNVATVRSSIAPYVHLKADINKVFGTNIKLSQTNTIMTPTAGIAVADNYKSMFSLYQILNDEN